MKHISPITKKLAGRKGASTLIAILVFFLAALSGTVALTMAASNAGRFSYSKEDRQADLTVTSAAKLILNRLAAVEIEYKSVDKEEPKSADKINITYLDAVTHGSISGLGLFFTDPRFDKMVKNFSLKKAEDTVPVEFTLTVPSAESMGQVYVNLRLQGTQFFFRFYSVVGGGRRYRMSMTVNSRFDRLGVGNFTVGSDGYYYRAMVFDTDTAVFEVEEVTGD